jgi:hypothetical protein
MTNFEVLRNIYTLATTQKDVHLYGTSLWFLISAFSEARASDPRDRIFGLLGMLGEGLQKDFISVDYWRSIEQLYQETTEFIIVYEQDLGLWRYLNLGKGVKGGENLPSWVPWFGRHATLFGIRQLDLISQVCTSPPLMQVEGSTLTVHSLIFDSITYATENISNKNVKPHIRHAFNNIASSPSSSIGQDEATVSLWQALINYDASLHDFSMSEKGFLSFMSQAIHIPEDPAAEAQEYYESQMRLDLWDKDLGLGRNLFRSSQGYFGVGLARRNVGGGVAPLVVEVGDYITLITNAHTPIILRPEHGRHWSIISAAIGGTLFEPVKKDQILLYHTIPCVLVMLCTTVKWHRRTGGLDNGTTYAQPNPTSEVK